MLRPLLVLALLATLPLPARAEEPAPAATSGTGAAPAAAETTPPSWGGSLDEALGKTAPAAPIPAGPVPTLHPRVGACDDADPTARVAAALGAAEALRDPALSAHDLASRLLAHGGPVCRTAPGGSSAIELAAVSTIPSLAATRGSESAWLTEHPLLVRLAAGKIHFARWPLEAIVLPATERDMFRRLLVEDRKTYSTRRIVVLHVEPDVSAAAVDEWVEDLARAGYASVSLTTAADAWTAREPEAGVFADWSSLPVRAPDEVILTPEGDFTLKFLPSSGMEPVHVYVDDIRFFQESCIRGTCELVLVTRTQRYFVLRGPEHARDDMTRRWLFGRPVVAFGESLDRLRGPTLVGDLMPLPRVSWGTADEKGRVTAEGRRASPIAEQGNFLIRPCWIKQTRARRAFPFFVGNPYGSIKVRFHVRGDGSVEEVDLLESTVANKVVQRCTVEGMRAMRLPRRFDDAPYSFETSYGFSY